MQVSAVKTMVYFLCPREKAYSVQLPYWVSNKRGMPPYAIYTQAGSFAFYSTRSMARVRLISTLPPLGIYLLGQEVCTVRGKT